MKSLTTLFFLLISCAFASPSWLGERLHNTTLQINGMFLHYGQGAFDWVYTTNDENRKVYKLQGMQTNGLLKWTPLISLSASLTESGSISFRCCSDDLVGHAEDRNETIAQLTHTDQFVLDGYFAHFDSGRAGENGYNTAFDWIYITKNKEVYKLDGMHANGYFSWTPLQTATVKSWSDVELDTTSVHFGDTVACSDYTIVQEPTTLCRLAGICRFNVHSPLKGTIADIAFGDGESERLTFADNNEANLTHRYLPGNHRLSMSVNDACPAQHLDVNISNDLYQDLVAYYPFDGSALDQSVHANHGTAHGSIQYVDGFEGKAAKFEGAMSEYILVPHSPSLAVSDEFTFSVWIKPEFVFDINPIITKGFYHEDYTLWIKQTGPSLLLNFATYQSFWVDDNTNVDASKWVFITVTMKNHVVRYYVNGVLTNSANFQYDIQNHEEDLYIGSSYPGGDEYYKGLIDELRIYRRALSQKEIQALYNEALYMHAKPSVQ